MESSPHERAGVVATSVAAPWGPVHVAATARGIVAVELMTTREAFTIGLERRLGRPIRWIDAPTRRPRLRARTRTRCATSGQRSRPCRLGPPAAERGRQRADDALGRLPIDLEDRPAWDRAVLDAVRAIPRGEVRSYGDIARAIGRPGAARAVGGAVGRNPVGLLVPCHRVVAGDGTLGGYGGGWWGDHERLLDLKAELLAREGVSLPRSPSRGRRGR